MKVNTDVQVTTPTGKTWSGKVLYYPVPGMPGYAVIAPPGSHDGYTVPIKWCSPK
jgi:hypothetical protein